MEQKYHSENVFGAGNQQERSKIEWWIVGFTDGEGCFSVSMIKNKTTKTGWQIFPEFVVTQGEKSLSSLQAIQNYFGCGRIFINKRYDNHNENLYRFCIRSIKDLHEKIVPFFKTHQLLTAKQNDFAIFSEIIDDMVSQKHFTPQGVEKIAKKIEKMNRKKTSRFLKSSETNTPNPDELHRER